MPIYYLPSVSLSFLYIKRKKHLVQILHTNNIRTNAYIKIYMGRGYNKIGNVYRIFSDVILLKIVIRLKR